MTRSRSLFGRRLAGRWSDLTRRSVRRGPLVVGGELEAEMLREIVKSGHRGGGEVLVADEDPVGMVTPVSRDDGVDHCPQKRGLVEDVARAASHRRDVVAELGHEVVDESRLREEA